jgi:uncharacterized phage-associated protein
MLGHTEAPDRGVDSTMATVLDVAQYTLNQRGEITAMKLHKLVYYCQAWSIVWTGNVMFHERIWACNSGPVVRELYEAHRGRFRVDAVAGGFATNLTGDERATVDRVLSFYGDKSAQWLSDLTHIEDPWKQAWRAGTVHQRRYAEITLDSIAQYYSDSLSHLRTSMRAAPRL